MKFGKRIAVVSMSVMTATAMSAKAQQYMPQMAGTGYNMGQQACPYGVQAGAGAASYLDDYNDIKKNIAEKKRMLSELKQKKRDLDKELRGQRAIISGSISDRYLDMIYSHMDNQRYCSEYEGYQEPPPRSVPPAPVAATVPAPPSDQPAPPPPRPQAPPANEPIPSPKKGKKPKPETSEAQRQGQYSAEENQSRMPAQAREDERHTRAGYGDDDDREESAGGLPEKTIPVRGMKPEIWQRDFCSKNRSGAIKGRACEMYKLERSKYSPDECKTALKDYRETKQELEVNRREMQQIDAEIKALNKELPQALRDAKERWKEETEAGICPNCIANGNGYVTQHSGPNWPSVAANGIVAGLAMYMGYKTNKMVAEKNSDLGWPTQATPAWGYGLPFALNAVYGALGGGVGTGAFGCAGGGGGGLYGNMGMNGPFGYPQGMFGGQLGGGMYNGGMGPWGVPGPWGLGGGGQFGMPGYPMMGATSPYGAMGAMSPYGAFMSGGLGLMSPYAGYMMGGGAMMGGGYMMPGAMMGGMAGGMMPGYMMGGGAMMGGGYMMPGAMMGGMAGGMMPGYMMGGMAGGMMPGYMMGGGAMMGGGYMMPGSMMGGGLMMGGGYMMPGSMMGGMSGGMMDPQYQQAMMQMQMQQQQMYMQQQQQAAQNQMARQQTYMGLAQQMQELQIKMQMVMSGASITGMNTSFGTTGASYGGVYGSGSIYTGSGNPSVPIPAPGNGVNAPGGGVGGGTIIPASGR